MNSKTEKPDQMSDFSEFFLAESVSFKVELPNGKPMMFEGQPVKVVLYGPGSEVYERAYDRMTMAINARVMSRLATEKDGKVPGQFEADDAQNKDIQLQFLTDVTVRFENFPFPGGIKAIYTDRRLSYINTFVDRKFADLGNFLPGGKSN